MPFQQTNALPPNPQVKIFFHGLAILRSSDGLSCLAELHREPDREHSLSIEIRVKDANKPDLILLRRFGKLPGSTGPGDGMTITVTPALPPARQGAFKFLPFNVDPFVDRPNGQNDSDFGWVVNMASGRYHGPAIGLKRSGTRAGVLIQGGDCRLYTASLLVRDIDVTQGGAPHGTIHGLGALVGANLYYDAGSEAVINVPDVGTLSLPSGGPSFEIYIENSPLFVDDDHDELKEYYNVLRKERDDSGKKFPAGEQFKFDLSRFDPDFTGPAKIDTNVGSARIPCQSIVLE